MSPEISSPQAGTKRAYQADEGPGAANADKHAPASPPATSTATATSAFRNVSACNRCRVRKNRCDQQLPACSACTKAGVRCVGYDPITKREIPRSYVYFLETRLSYFESLLNEHNIPVDPAEVFDADSRILTTKDEASPKPQFKDVSSRTADRSSDGEQARQKHEDEKLDHLVSNIGMISVHGASDNRYLGSTSGISFARIVLSAVKKASPLGQTDKSGSKLTKTAAVGAAGSTMRDSYFGLQMKPHFKEAPFPDRELGEKLATLYFEHANPQIPILHREEFWPMFDKAYTLEHESRTPRQLYLLNIVFAIGAGTIWGMTDPEPSGTEYAPKRARLTSQSSQPEEYHACAIAHLSTFLSSSDTETKENGGGDLEELQAVLLLAGFALLRPIAPGLWYIVGVAMRLAIDLGLHYEDGSGLNDTELAPRAASDTTSKKAQQQGRRQYMRDLRRRLWWCTYTFDRLVSTCVGRPFGITDQVITTEFPSLLDDKYITKQGFTKSVSPDEPTYKRVAHHYFRLRLLQSEIVQVLQYEQARMARLNGWNRQNEYMHTKLQSPFLMKHKSFRSWRKDVDQRLFEWKESAPRKADTAVSFSPGFLELNYWQAVTMLYRQSLSVPPPFAGELSPTEDVASPSSVFTEDKEDEDLVFLKCAEAGQKTLKLYRQLHRLRLVNYTYLATHHLFMAGISFLYAVWHSPAVRSRITLDDFDFTVLAATSVLGDLMTKCPPAEACRDAFERMSKATVQMCMSTPGFGFGTRDDPYRTPTGSPAPKHSPPMQHTSSKNTMRPIAKRPAPKFDMDLRDLFPDGLNPNTRHNTSTGRPRSNTQRSNRQPRANIYRRPSQPQDIPMASQPHQDSAMQDTTELMEQTGRANYGVGYPMYDESQQALDQPTYLDPGSNSYNPDFMSNLPGMDILNRLGSTDESAQMMASQSMGMVGGNPNIDPQLDDSWLDMGRTMSTDGDTESDWGLGSGFGVGVGMGLDFGPQHDWSDGQGGFNLFDGFFFGGDNAGNSMQ